MNNERLAIKLNEILENDNELQKFLIYILIRNKKILASSIIIEDEAYKNIDDVIRIKDNAENGITIIIDSKELGIREIHENKDKLITEVELLVKLLGDNTFRVACRDTMATNDGKSQYVLPGSKRELTIFSSRERFPSKIFKY